MSTSTHEDVIIIGAGPAGLMASMYLSELGVKHRIIDKLGTRALNGRADGFHVRTVEIWKSFGLLDRLLQHANHFGEWALWTPDQDGIHRSTTQPCIGEDVSTMHTASFHQGFIEAALIEGAKLRGGPRVERGIMPTSLQVDAFQAGNADTYPVTLELKHLEKADLEQWAINAHSVSSDGTFKEERGNIDAFGADPEDITDSISGQEGLVETVHAKYVIATDGGHSWVRHQLPGFQMEGVNTNSAWAVIDIKPITDFPDIRKNCSILSGHGSVLIIPREDGLVRLYIQLPHDTKVQAGKEEAVRQMMDTARAIFHPYKLEYRYCDWWTIYRVGQRVSNHFSYLDRVLLAGDAVHTHTPKGGQGMNVSQQDAYNMAWKIAGVVSNQLRPAVLSTYESERRPLAKALIDLDTDLATVLDSGSTADQTEVNRVYGRLREYGSGVNIRYEPSLIVSSVGECNPVVAKHLKVGMRMPDARIYQVASATPAQLHSLLGSDGTWKLLAFAGDTTDTTVLNRVNAAGEGLVRIQKTFATGSAKLRSFMRTFLIQAQEASPIDSSGIHHAYFPLDEWSGRDYTTVYADSLTPHPLRSSQDRVETKSHTLFGVDQREGAMVLCRPDQMIAWIGRFEDVDKLQKWLGGFLVPKV